ncbi:MAG: DNA polymerase/3'-5' exonuclease PolX [Planctomycetota bacterium]
MGKTAEIAGQFEQIAQMLELLGENRFKVNAHAKVARVLGDLGAEVETIAGDGDAKARSKRLQELDGVGASAAEKIVEYLDTGAISERDTLAANVPAGLIALLGLQGLGPKTVKLLWDQLGVVDAAGLKRVIEDGSIMGLPRMGQKTVDNITKALKYAHEAGRRMPLGMVRPLAEQLVEQMLAIKGVNDAAFAGSLRRGKETIGDIDILVTAENPASVHEAFRSLDGVREVLASGESKTSVRLLLPQNFGRWRGLAEDDEPTIQADLRVVPAESWGAALMYFTGSKEHNVRLRERAIKQGLTLNEYGLFEDDSSQDEPPQKRGLTPVASESEAAVYAKLGVPEVPPELREDRGELNAGELPELVTVDSIRAELHAHTTESDGRLKLEELVSCAEDRGFHTIAVTDHSKSSVQANGLSVDRLQAQRKAIEAVRAEHPDISILCGNEVDILVDGTLDYDDDVLREMDYFVASPHASLSQDPKTATKRLLRVIEHPLSRVIGHPTGRLIGRRPGLEPAMDEIIAACREHDVALEINAHWVRLDLRDTHVRAAVELGVLIAINCDVHVAEDFDNLRYGVQTGRRGWLTKDLCVNTWDRETLAGWIETGKRPG